MTRNRNLIVTGLAVCFLAATAMAQDKDAEGSKDHPLISRYPGSYIDGYNQKEYEEFDLPLGMAKDSSGTDPEIFEKHQHLEGKLTLISYTTPAGRSTLEVFRNYKSALAKAGFVTLFECKGSDTGPGECGPMQGYVHHRFEQGAAGEPDQRYVAAKLARPEGDVYVEVHVHPEGALLSLIEMKPMESELITVDAASLANDLNRSGHASVYGIYFDTGKAEVKPESDAALKEIAKLLQQDPKLKLHVVGHTDNVGTLVSNMDLSRRRADAVAKVLTTKYTIAASRLAAQGVGPLAPVASNKSEEGRAKNRRVELVEQ